MPCIPIVPWSGISIFQVQAKLSQDFGQYLHSTDKKYFVTTWRLETLGRTLNLSSGERIRSGYYEDLDTWLQEAVVIEGIRVNFPK